MLIMPPKALHSGQSCGMARAVIATVVGEHGTGNAACGRGTGSRDGSLSGLTFRRRTGLACAAPLRLPPQVGAGDDPGQDAQPVPNSLLLFRRVLRQRPAGRSPAAGKLPPLTGLLPGVPGGPRRPVLVLLPVFCHISRSRRRLLGRRPLMAVPAGPIRRSGRAAGGLRRRSARGARCS